MSSETACSSWGIYLKSTKDHWWFGGDDESYSCLSPLSPEQIEKRRRRSQTNGNQNSSSLTEKTALMKLRSQ